MKQCYCRSLDEYIENKSIPIEFERKRKEFSLILDKLTKVKISYCFVCGGNRRGVFENNLHDCKCGSVQTWSQVTSYPIKFDDNTHEYYLLDNKGVKYFMYFCPICGGKLPESKINDFFITPSESEVNDISNKIKGVDDVDELIKKLGTPDEENITTIEETEKQNRLGRKTAKRTLVYNSIASTFSFIVVEDENGKISYLSAGKPKSE